MNKQVWVIQHKRDVEKRGRLKRGHPQRKKQASDVPNTI